MKIEQVAEALERFAPLPLQEDYDNAGLQIGLTAEDNLTGVLLCLDVTEDVIREAAERGLNLVVSHHPLLFRGLKQVTERTMVERCVRLAIKHNIAVYSAHTNLDNVRGGVNWEIVRRLLPEVEESRIEPLRGGEGGYASGAIVTLPEPLLASELFERIKKTFGAEKIATNWSQRDKATRRARRIALCGGAGDFLLQDAMRRGADVFLTGEMHYHQYFLGEDDILIGVFGHYESEQFTISLLARLLREALPSLRVETTGIITNPIHII